MFKDLMTPVRTSPLLDLNCIRVPPHEALPIRLSLYS